ncbi:MAG TPA: thioesterase family protein [Flavobacteriaceae bacterium]|nr:thioesterase family protein [Flavobacteriaceae bacterium]
MISHLTQIRVRYSETDQMGYVYYGNYAQYFEVGRVEWLRNLGISYKTMEDEGVMLPVINLQVTYLKPAKYDNLLTLKTTLVKKPSVRIEFTYELFNEQEELLVIANTELVFIDIFKNKPTKSPAQLLQKIEEYF